MDHSPDFADLFQQLDGMVNAYDSEGSGPLRKGEQPFSWAAVEKLALPLADRVPDVRVGIWLLRAGLARAGLSGLSDGMARIAAWMRLPATELHPLPDSDEPPRELHGLLLAWLATPVFLSAVREAALSAEVPAPKLSELLSGDDLGSVLAGISVDHLHATLLRAASCAQTVDNILIQECEDVSLASLRDILSRAITRLNEFTSIDAPSDLASPDTATSEPKPSAPSSQTQLKCREEVHLALEQIIAYFQQHEPGHPAPLFLTRVQRMLGADFGELMSELFPDAQQLVAKLSRPSGG